MIREAIDAVVSGRSLAMEDAATVMRQIMEGEATPGQLGALLAALRIKGETAEEIAGFATVMRENAVRVNVDGLWSTLWAPAATGTTPLISPPPPPSWRREPGLKWPSMATGQPPALAAPPMCWRHWGSSSTCRRRAWSVASTRSDSASCSLRHTTRRPATPRQCAGR